MGKDARCWRGWKMDEESTRCVQSISYFTQKCRMSVKLFGWLVGFITKTVYDHHTVHVCIVFLLLFFRWTVFGVPLERFRKIFTACLQLMVMSIFTVPLSVTLIVATESLVLKWYNKENHCFTLYSILTDFLLELLHVLISQIYDGDDLKKQMTVV